MTLPVNDQLCFSTLNPFLSLSKGWSQKRKLSSFKLWGFVGEVYFKFAQLKAETSYLNNDKVYSGGGPGLASKEL